MADPLIITISHNLGKAEALRRIKPAFSKALENFPLLQIEHEIWSGDRLDFRVKALRQVAVGNVQVEEAAVRLEATLPWLLQKFSQTIRETISRRGRAPLGKK
jgi:hypothetical protein